MPPILSARHVSKLFAAGRREIMAVADLSFDVEEGELVCLIGA